MYRTTKPSKTTIKQNTSYIGETIENKIRRIVNNKEPISDGAPLIYTDRKDGVQPAMDIRTDRWEVAVEAMDKVTKAHQAKREERLKTIGEKAQEGMNKENNPGTGVNTSDTNNK